MGDALNQIFDACKLARELEKRLPHLANYPPLLFSSSEEVAGAFNKAIREMHSHNSSHYSTKMFFGQTLGSLSDMRTGCLPLDIPAGEGSSHGGSYMQGVNFSQQGLPMEEDDPFHRCRTSEDLGLEIQATSMTMRMVDSTRDTNIEALGRGGGEALVAAEGSSMVAERRPARSSIQRSSRGRRRDSGGTILRVPARRTGNMEIPPDDGYTWRKYGQKDILRSRFPRSYYRCTHKSYYGCEAKKQVQRLDEDPYTYEIKYCGTHSCNTSTAPLLIPSLTPNTNTNSNTNNGSSSSNYNRQGEAPAPEATAQPPSSLPTSIELGIWFSGEFDHGQREIPSLIGSNTQAGPSNLQDGRDIDCPVAALADVMFNSGGSGSTMDAFFSQSRQDNRRA